MAKTCGNCKYYVDKPCDESSKGLGTCTLLFVLTRRPGEWNVGKNWNSEFCEYFEPKEGEGNE